MLIDPKTWNKNKAVYEIVITKVLQAMSSTCGLKYLKKQLQNWDSRLAC